MDKILQKGFLLAQKKTNNFKLEKDLEKTAREIFEFIEIEKEYPTQSTLRVCKEFLREVEKWKMMFIECRLGNADLNSDHEIYSSFRGAFVRKNDKEKLLSIMNLKGFGSSIDEDFNRRSKAASAVMRFFYPDTWGVVDWRLMAVLQECKSHSWDWPQIIKSERAKSKDLRRDFDVINDDMCIWLMQEYRSIANDSHTFSRVADIDMSLFHLSWCLWAK